MWNLKFKSSTLSIIEGMSQALLESVQIPCKLSDTKEWYNVDLVEKLLQILFSACQHGSKIRLVTLDAAIDMLKVNNY